MRLIGYDSSDNFGPYVNSETSVNFLTAKKLVRENLNKDPDSVMEALTKVGMAKIAVHTNLNKVSIIFGKKDPCVRIPQLNKNHPLIHPWVKSRYSNKVANELLKEKKQIYGGVDFITGKVHGDFCDVPISIFMPLKALKDTSVELECLVAATLHEIGHIFGMYAFMGRLFTTNLRLSSLHEKLLARDSGNHRLTIIAQTLEDINPKAVLKAEDLEKFEDQDAMDIAIISEAVNDSVSELGHNVYDHTSWEAIADEYAIKNGAEMWLPKMLDKVYDEQINISGRPLPVFLLFEIIKMLFTLLLPPLGILIILQDRRAPTYDAPEARFNRMRNALMESINLDETLSREDIQSLKDSIDTIDKIVLDDQPEARAALATRTGRRTVPQIFIGDYHVGGFDDLAALNRSGELDRLLATP
jgi:glutaredoxin